MERTPHGRGSELWRERWQEQAFPEARVEPIVSCGVDALRWGEGLGRKLRATSHVLATAPNVAGSRTLRAR